LENGQGCDEKVCRTEKPDPRTANDEDGVTGITGESEYEHDETDKEEYERQVYEGGKGLENKIELATLDSGSEKCTQPGLLV
jgi:hypothetical protein